MKLARRAVLLLVLLASIGVWYWLSRLADEYREVLRSEFSAP